MNPILDPSQLGLRDIHLPGEIVWWPFAVGWWVLGIVSMGLIIALALRHSRSRRHRAACRVLQKLASEIRTGADPRLCAVEASTTLRRFAMTMAKDSADVAGLVGDRWWAYLDSHWDRSAFSETAGQQLLASPYRAANDSAAEDSLELCSLCVAWVKAQPLRS